MTTLTTPRRPYPPDTGGFAGPATARQAGALAGRFAGLGVTDRAERLAVCAALLGLDGLATSRDLTVGQAGRLLHALGDCQDRAELPDVTGGQAEGATPAQARPSGGPARPVAILAALGAALCAWQVPPLPLPLRD